MARYQVPENLIEQLQILLRKEALLESFNPKDPLIPPLPTLEEAIAGIGTSDDQLRCRYCKGELLRGSESIICVYCGHGQQQEAPPQPIALKSTLGFGWLLQSLLLDGSESVGPPIAGTQSNREQKSHKDGMALSEFLNLDLKWPDESKRFGMVNESPLAGERPSTLVGVALNELFPEGNRDNPSSVCGVQRATSKKLEPEEADTFIVQKSPNFFEDTHSSEFVLKSNEGEIVESFSGWEAEFQSAVPDDEHQHMHSFEAIADAPVNTTSHINSVQGHVEVEKLENMLSSQAHLGNNFIIDNLDSKFALPSHSIVEDVGNVVKPIDGSSGFTWPLDGLQKASVADSSRVESGVGDDSFDDWNDFRSSTDVDNNHSEPSTATPSGTENRGLDTSDGWKDFTGSVGVESNQPKTNIVSGLVGDSLDVWNDFTTSSSAGDNKLQMLGSEVHQQKQHDGGESMLGGNDFASLNAVLQDGQGIHTDASQNKTFSQNDPVGFWSAGISMAVLDNQLLGPETQSPVIGTTKEADDSFNLWNDLKSSTGETQQVNSVKEADNEISVKDDKTSDVSDNFASLGASKNEQQISWEKSINRSFVSWNDNSFNAWNDFTGSSGVSVSKPSNSDTDFSFGEWNDFSSSAISHRDQHQSSGKKGAESQTALEYYDPLNSWSNLRSLETQAENSFPSTIVTESSQGQISTGQPSESLKVMKYSSPFDAWGRFGHSVLVADKQSRAGGVELSENKQTDDENDFFCGWIESGKQSANPPNNQVNGNGVMAHGDKSISENADSFDAWACYTSSINVPVNRSLNNSANKPVDNDAVKSDDIFDSWNVLASSSDVQAGNDTTVPKENMPGISLFSTTTNSQGVERDNTYQQDLFLSVTSDQNGSSKEVSSPSRVPDLVRMENDGGKADGYSAQINQIESTKETSDLKPSDAEMLVSEMHDLSFMLENSLSIPKTKSSE